MLPARGATATEKYGIWDGVSAPSFFSGLPVVAAALADPHGLVSGPGLILFWGKQLHNQSGECQENPLNGQPPPADEDPPQDTVTLLEQLRLRDHLCIDLFAAAFGANHVYPLLSYLVIFRITLAYCA